MRRYMYDFILSPDQTPLSKTQKMKYLKPLALYQQLMKTNANNQCHRLFGLEMRDKYLNLAVSNPVNTIAAPLWQENDTGLMVDKLRTLISEHNAVGFVVCYPYHLFYSKAKGKEVKNFVDDLCKTKKMEGLMYTYWDNLITLKDMDFALDHNVGFICQQLNLPEDVSKKIMDRFYAAQVLQVCSKTYSNGSLNYLWSVCRNPFFGCLSTKEPVKLMFLSTFLPKDLEL